MAKAAEIHDPSLFRRMAEPFADAEAANAAIKLFYDDLRALREKHRIRDVVTIAGGAYLSDEGEEVEWIVDSIIGDVLKAEYLTAYAFGRAQAERQERVGRALSHKQVVERPKSGK